MAHRRFIAKQIPATWPLNTAWAAAIWASAVREAMQRVGEQVKLPVGYHLNWASEIREQKRSEKRLLVVLRSPFWQFVILYTMFGSSKWASLILENVAIAPIGGLLALLITGTHLSVSSGVGFLALFGVSVETGVIMLEYINQLRAAGHTIEAAAVEGAVLRLRPIMMTMLVATLGLLPAALSRGIGSDSQRPFAIVIVGGLIIAAGGITQQTTGNFILEGATAIGVGTDLIPSHAIEHREATRIRELAHRFVGFVGDARRLLEPPKEQPKKSKTDFWKFHRNANPGKP